MKSWRWCMNYWDAMYGVKPPAPSLGKGEEMWASGGHNPASTGHSDESGSSYATDTAFIRVKCFAVRGLWIRRSRFPGSSRGVCARDHTRSESRPALPHQQVWPTPAISSHEARLFLVVTHACPSWPSIVAGDAHYWLNTNSAQNERAFMSIQRSKENPYYW